MRLECEVSGINCLDHNYTGEATRHTLTLGLLASHANHLSAESGSLRLELRDPAYRQLCSWLNMDSELKKERDDALKELLEMRKWRDKMLSLTARIGNSADRDMTPESAGRSIANDALKWAQDSYMKGLKCAESSIASEIADYERRIES